MANIKELRTKAGLTQYALARKLGVSQSAVAQWEQGTTSPKKTLLRPLSELLNCSVLDLIDEAG